MDAEALARATGLSLEEARELAAEGVSLDNDFGTDSHQKQSLCSDIAFLEDCFPNVPRSVIEEKLRQCRDLEQASDLLLNYEATKNEKDQIIPRNLSRRAKANAKRQKKLDASKAQRDNDIEMLTKVIDDLSLEDARELYTKHDNQFDLAVFNYYKNWSAPHVQALIADMERHRPVVNNIKPVVSSQPTYSGHDVSDAMARKGAELDAELEKLEGYKRVKGVPRTLISECQGRIADLKEQLGDLEVMVAQAKYSDTESVLDFHNMTVRAATTVCANRLQAWKINSEDRELYLVTGAGRHSLGGVPKIKNAIRELLKEKNDGSYFVHEDEGAFLLRKARV